MCQQHLSPSARGFAMLEVTALRLASGCARPSVLRARSLPSMPSSSQTLDLVASPRQARTGSGQSVFENGQSVCSGLGSGSAKPNCRSRQSVSGSGSLRQASNVSSAMPSADPVSSGVAESFVAFAMRKFPVNSCAHALTWKWWHTIGFAHSSLRARR